MKFATAALSLLLVSNNIAADWPQFLGPNRNGVVPDETIRSSFDPEPTIAWEHKVGTGHAGAAIAKGKCIIFHRVDDRATVDALDAESGKPLWQFTYQTDYRDDFGFDSGPRATPTIAGGRIYTYGAEGMLHCIDLTGGKQVWSLDTKKIGSAKGFFGRASSPIVINGKVIIQLDGIRAFNAVNGEPLWHAATEQEAGYSTPTIAEIGGEIYSLHLTREGFACLDPRAGKVLIEEKFRSTNNASVNAATPLVFDGNKVFLSSCYDVGAALWQINPKDQSKKVVWQRGDVLDAHYATPVPVNGMLFGYHGRQETGQELRCVKLIDGEVLWNEPLATGSLIAIGKQLVILTEKGELILAPTSSKGLKPTARGQILGATTRAASAFAGGFLYARDGKRLVCVDLRKD
ncbi:MAG: outer membrane protein assembly factor BamB [Pseudoalteromonas tetraodonis]|jgi:outer membrane protein assembly factor BamB